MILDVLGDGRIRGRLYVLGDVYDFMIFSGRFNLLQECVEEKHKRHKKGTRVKRGRVKRGRL